MKSQKLFPKSIKIYYCSPKYLGYKKTNLRPCCCFIKILALESLGSHKILPLEGSCEFSETQPYLCNFYSTQWAYLLSPAVFNNLLDLALSKNLSKILSEVFRKTRIYYIKCSRCWKIDPKYVDVQTWCIFVTIIVTMICMLITYSLCKCTMVTIWESTKPSLCSKLPRIKDIFTDAESAATI